MEYPIEQMTEIVEKVVKHYHSDFQSDLNLLAQKPNKKFIWNVDDYGTCIMFEDDGKHNFGFLSREFYYTWDGETLKKVSRQEAMDFFGIENPKKQRELYWFEKFSHESLDF